MIRTRQASLWLPAGWILCERSHDGRLIYGARQSMFFKRKGTVANYVLAKTLLSAAGHHVGRMEQVVNVLQHEIGKRVTMSS